MIDATTASPTQPVQLFSASGRIGRLRYLAYCTAVCLVLAVAGGALAGFVAAFLVPSLGPAAFLVVLVPWVAVLVLVFMLTIQRCHDFVASGWMSLLLLIPFAGLIFWFIPGTDGPNRFGLPTPPNGPAVIVGAVAVPIVLVFFVGILAAVAIPAYGDYTQRAQVSDVIMAGSAWRSAVNEHYAETRKLPSSPAELRQGLAPVGADSRHGIATLGDNGVITLTLSQRMGGASVKTILMRPRVAGDTLEWDCTGGTLQPKYRPSRCRPQ